MNHVGLMTLLEGAGIKVSWAKLLGLAPLLSKASSDLSDSDVEMIFSTFGLPVSDAKLISETGRAIRTSNFDTVSEMISSDDYFLPLVSRVLGPVKKTVDEDDPAKVKCLICSDPVAITKTEAEAVPRDETIVKTCGSCYLPSAYTAGMVLNYWNN